MSTRPPLTALILASVLAAPAVAGQGTPDTFPPETGILTPYNSARTAAPDEYPSASVRTTPQCAGQCASTLLNGASIPAATAESAPATGPQSVAAPTMVNGAPVPASGAPLRDRTWCEGTYRPDAGTNFGE